MVAVRRSGGADTPVVTGEVVAVTRSLSVWRKGGRLDGAGIHCRDPHREIAYEFGEAVRIR